MEVEYIAKAPAEEAIKIAAGENLVGMDMEEAPINADAPNRDTRPTSSVLQALSRSLELVVSQHKSGAPSSSCTAGPNFDEVIARIPLPLTQRTTEAADAANDAEDFALLEIMAVGFKVV